LRRRDKLCIPPYGALSTVRCRCRSKDDGLGRLGQDNEDWLRDDESGSRDASGCWMMLARRAATTNVRKLDNLDSALIWA
jgi:hypothetical protein